MQKIIPKISEVLQFSDLKSLRQVDRQWHAGSNPIFLHTSILRLKTPEEIENYLESVEFPACPHENYLLDPTITPEEPSTDDHPRKRQRGCSYPLFQKLLGKFGSSICSLEVPILWICTEDFDQFLQFLTELPLLFELKLRLLPTHKEPLDPSKVVTELPLLTHFSVQLQDPRDPEWLYQLARVTFKAFPKLHSLDLNFLPSSWRFLVNAYLEIIVSPEVNSEDLRELIIPNIVNRLQLHHLKNVCSQRPLTKLSLGLHLKWTPEVSQDVGVILRSCQKTLKVLELFVMPEIVQVEGTTANKFSLTFPLELPTFPKLNRLDICFCLEMEIPAANLLVDIRLPNVNYKEQFPQLKFLRLESLDPQKSGAFMDKLFEKVFTRSDWEPKEICETLKYLELNYDYSKDAEKSKKFLDMLMKMFPAAKQTKIDKNHERNFRIHYRRDARYFKMRSFDSYSYQ